MYSVTDSFLVLETPSPRIVVGFGSDDDILGYVEEALAVEAEDELYAVVLLTYGAAFDEAVKFEFATLWTGAWLRDALSDEADARVDCAVPTVELPVKLEFPGVYVAEFGGGTEPEVEDENTDTSVVRRTEVVEELVTEADEVMA